FTPDTNTIIEHCVRFTKQKMDYVEGNRNNFVHQLACNLNRKGVGYSEALRFILSDYNYNEIEVMNAVKSAYNNTHEFGTDSEYKTKPKKNVIPNDNEESQDDEEEKPAAIERLEMFLNKRYNFRYNMVTGKLEYKKVRNQMYKPIIDFVENSI